MSSGVVKDEQTGLSRSEVVNQVVRIIDEMMNSLWKERVVVTLMIWMSL